MYLVPKIHWSWCSDWTSTYQQMLSCGISLAK